MTSTTPTTPTRPPAHQPQPPAVSGAITTVTSRTGTPVTIHRAAYAVLAPTGGWTVHGYAWRCPCRRLALGYRAEQFGRALADGRDHQCEVPRD
ncbi:hypothetical protein ACF1DY_01895 [Streptomyces albus]